MFDEVGKLEADHEIHLDRTDPACKSGQLRLEMFDRIQLKLHLITERGSNHTEHKPVVTNTPFYI